MNTPLSQELIKMAREDIELRSILADDGSLFNAYHPEMKAVHDRNAKRFIPLLRHHQEGLISRTDGNPHRRVEKECGNAR